MGENEKLLQEKYKWDRAEYGDYNSILAYYQVQSCLENVHGNSLLDLACGDGTLTEVFSGHFERVVGVDASSKHLATAKKNLPHIEFHESLIEEFDINEKFSTILLLLILEHVIDPVLLLRKAAEFLKDDGVLIVHVPNANAINRKIAVKMGTLKTCDELSPWDINIAGHRRSYTLETISEDILAAGLKIKKTGGIFYKMFSTPQMDWILKNGLWDTGHGWGREGVDNVDWKSEFCRACYEIGKERPEDCNVIYVCIIK